MGYCTVKSRKVNCDLWGVILKCKKLLRVFKRIYRPKENVGRVFVLRIDQTRPEKGIKPLTKFSTIQVDKHKFEYFYRLAPRKLRHTIRRERGLTGDLSMRLLNHFEMQLHIIVWRTYFFKLPTQVKASIQKGHVYVNHNRIDRIGLRVQPYDYLFFNPAFISLSNFLHEIRQNYFIHLEAHLMVSYEKLSVVILPLQDSLFFWFPFDPFQLFYSKLNK
jgi:hypothetical protein